MIRLCRSLTSSDKELNNLMNFDPLYQPYPSYRVPVYAKQGMVATSQPLAAQAGLDVLKKAAMPSMPPLQLRQHSRCWSQRPMALEAMLLPSSGPRANCMA